MTVSRAPGLQEGAGRAAIASVESFTYNGDRVFMIRSSWAASEIRSPEYSSSMTSALARRRPNSADSRLLFAMRSHAARILATSASENGSVATSDSLGAFNFLASLRSIQPCQAANAESARRHSISFLCVDALIGDAPSRPRREAMYRPSTSSVNSAGEVTL